MLAPFPRTSVYPTIGPRVYKNNKKLGKVSYQMQKIIEDIQGPKPEKTNGDVQRKRVNERERDEAAYHERRSQRRKSRKQRETENEVKEMACQTSLLVPSSGIVNSDKKSELHTKTLSLKDKKTQDNCDESSRRSQGSDKIRSNKRDMLGKSKRNDNPHWKRPLPPVPVSSDNHHKQANLYQKVFETLKDKLQTDCENVIGNGHSGSNRWTTLSSTQKGVSHMADLDSRRDNVTSRYVDIDILSEKKNKYPPSSGSKDKLFEKLVPRNLLSVNESNFDDEHIYESIDDNSDVELDSCGKIRGKSGIESPKQTDSGDSVLFSPAQSTPCGRRIFRPEDTYLEPICPTNNYEESKPEKSTVFGHVNLFDNVRNSNSCPLDCDQLLSLSQSPDGGNSGEDFRCFCPVTDYQYSRELARSPTWSNYSGSEESVTLKAIYV